MNDMKDAGIDRITSYNVCYTKLLRDSVAQSESIHKEILDANVDLINQIQAETRASVESLHYMFSLLSRPTDLRLPRAVFDDLISSGGTQLIRSDA